MKKAFTLSEALIVLGIVSVLAAMSVSAVNNVKPDKNVILFRKAYKTTRTIINDLIADKNLYSCYINTSDVIAKELNICTVNFYIRDGITTDNKTYASYLSGYSTNKFMRCFANKANGIGISYASSPATATFTTPDGIYWKITDTFSSGTSGTAVIEVYPEGSGSVSKSCTYDATKCPAPNKFTLTVSNDGIITTDNAGCTYLRYSDINKVSKFTTYCN